MVTKNLGPISAMAALALSGVLFSAGCESEGPAEKAGAQVDKVIQNAKDTISPPGPAEKAGRALDKAGKD
jgi:hypothetical protein